MNYMRNRKYPRVAQKEISGNEESTLDISMAAAVGVVALAFVKGLFWGYILRKSIE